MIHRREMAEPLGQLFTFDHGFKGHRVGKLDLFREGNAGLQPLVQDVRYSTFCQNLFCLQQACDVVVVSINNWQE